MICPKKGSIIAGKYRLERALAEGGMGSVWVAFHLQLDVTVAIKFMVPEYATSADASVRFEREAKAAAQLKSPHVVQVHDYGVEDNTPYIVMELLEGEDLAARLKRRVRLSVADTALIIFQVCKALRRAHGAGIIHRDLKPGNIFLMHNDEEEVVKVLDFGIAKVLNVGIAKAMLSGLPARATSGNMLLGSPHYMSPEQVCGSKGLDHRTDLWSLGVIVFRTVTGQLPFSGKDDAEVFVQIRADPIPVASQIAPDLSPEVDYFFERALARDRAKRFQSAREFAEALDALSASTGARSLFISAPPSSAAGEPTMIEDLAVTAVLPRPPPPVADSSLDNSHPSASQVESTLASPTISNTFAPAGRNVEPHPRSGRILVSIAITMLLLGGTSLALVRARGHTPSLLIAAQHEGAPSPPIVAQTEGSPSPTIAMSPEPAVPSSEGPKPAESQVNATDAQSANVPPSASALSVPPGSTFASSVSSQQPSSHRSREVATPRSSRRGLGRQPFGLRPEGSKDGR